MMLGILEGRLVSLRSLLTTHSKLEGKYRLAVRRDILRIRKDLHKQQNQIRTEKARIESQYNSRRADILTKIKKTKESSPGYTDTTKLRFELRAKRKQEDIARKHLGLPSLEELEIAEEIKKTRSSLKAPDYSRLNKRKLGLKRLEFLYVIALDPDISEEYKTLAREALGLDPKVKYGNKVEISLDMLVPVNILNSRTKEVSLAYQCVFNSDISGSKQDIIIPEFINTHTNILVGHSMKVLSYNIQVISEISPV